MAGLNEWVIRRLDGGCQDPKGVILDKGMESRNVRFRMDFPQIHLGCFEVAKGLMLCLGIEVKAAV